MSTFDSMNPLSKDTSIYRTAYYGPNGVLIVKVSLYNIKQAGNTRNLGYYKITYSYDSICGPLCYMFYGLGSYAIIKFTKINADPLIIVLMAKRNYLHALQSIGKIVFTVKFSTVMHLLLTLWLSF